MRMIPALVAIARDVAELCPEALYVNYSNPMTANCWAIREAVGIPVTGLCHGTFNVVNQLADFISALQTSGWFPQVELVTTQEKNTLVDFTLQGNFRDPEVEAKKKVAAKKAGAKKTVAKKSLVKKAAVRSSAGKKASAKKAPVKKKAVKKTAKKVPARVQILLGSESDLPVIEKMKPLLERFGLPYRLDVASAHRMPAKLHRVIDGDTVARIAGHSAVDRART